jgi:hypothetical protein
MPYDLVQRAPVLFGATSAAMPGGDQRQGSEPSFITGAS